MTGPADPGGRQPVASPDAATRGEAGPGETGPGEAGAGEVAPGEARPGEAPPHGVAPDERASRGAAARPLLVAGVVLLLALAAVLGLVAGSRMGSAPATPSESSVDAGFARDMGVHHAQAVEMSVLVRDRTDDPDVRQLALDIELTQQHQLGQMFGWLEIWGLPKSSAEPRMAWMSGHAGHEPVPAGGLMPGMVTQAQLNQLAAASGTDAERLYLQLMIPHHEGGIEMAEYAVREAGTEAVRHLAEMIVRSQNAELNVLNDMLAERGGPLE